jgi:hypothetical protein
MNEIFLNPDNVKDLIKTAEREDEVIVVRCKRKTKASKPGGPDVGDFYDLHCTRKPADYAPVGARDRQAEDAGSGVLTVYVSNRRDSRGRLGDWRRVNIDAVKKVIYRGTEYEVTAR